MRETALGEAGVPKEPEVNPSMSVQTGQLSRSMPRTGWILSGIVIAFMALDFGATAMGTEAVKKATLEVGFPLRLMWVVGALQLACLVLYAIPATSVFGAIILTGFLGAAVFSHLRVSGAVTADIVVGLVLGILAWGGLWCRESRLQALLPLRR